MLFGMWGRPGAPPSSPAFARDVVGLASRDASWRTPQLG